MDDNPNAFSAFCKEENLAKVLKTPFCKNVLQQRKIYKQHA
jgi:hypothetical protein